MKMTVGLETKVRRGVSSWTFIYTILGFALTIEATICSMIEPIKFPWNIALYVVVAASTWWLFLDNRWFQNKLIGWKNRNEDKER